MNGDLQDSLSFDVQVLAISGGRKLYHYCFKDSLHPEANTPDTVPFPVQSLEANDQTVEPEDQESP